MRKLFISFTSILLLVSCAGVGGLAPSPKATPEQKNSVLNDLSIKDGKVPVFIRRSNGTEPFYMTGYNHNILLNSEIIGTFSHGSFHRVMLPPGPHEFAVTYIDKHPKDANIGPTASYKKSDFVKSSVRVVDIPRKATIVTMSINPSSIKGYPGFEFFKDDPISDPSVIKKELEDYVYLIEKKPLIMNRTFITQAQQKKINEQREWNKIKDSKEAKLYSRYLLDNPMAHNKTQAQKLLLMSLQTKNDHIKYGKIHPELINQFPMKIKYEMLIMTLGPEGLTVLDILTLSKSGIGHGTLAAKIKSSNHKYKDFTIDEIVFLKDKGLKEILIQAMIEVTAQVTRDLKRAKENQEMMSKIQKLISESQNNQSNMRGLSSEEKSMPAECIKLKLALNACGQTSGLFNLACRSTAQASYDCNIKL